MSSEIKVEPDKSSGKAHGVDCDAIIHMILRLIKKLVGMKPVCFFFFT